MRDLFVLGGVLWLLGLTPIAEAQVSQPAVPTKAKLVVLPAAGDLQTTVPLAEREVDISPTSPLCNLPLTPPPTGAVINPTVGALDDPFTAGRECRIAMPTGLPEGTGYRGAVSFFFAVCNPDGKTPGSCTSIRTLGAPPFSIVNPRPPFAPTAVRILP